MPGLVLVTALVLSAAPISAQETLPAAQDAALSEVARDTSQAPVIRPIPPTEIADSAVATRTVLRQASQAAADTADLASISARLPDATERIDYLERDSRRRLQTPGPSFALNQTLHAWQRTADLLRG